MMNHTAITDTTPTTKIKRSIARFTDLRRKNHDITVIETRELLDLVRVINLVSLSKKLKNMRKGSIDF